MRYLFSVLLVVIAYSSFCQNWSKLPRSNIEFSNFTHTNHDNWLLIYHEYFRKGDKIICVSRGLTEDFYAMFTETPLAFDNIFNNCHLITTPDLDTLLPRFDSSILKVKYKQAAIVESREVTYGYKEVIWVLKNYTWSYPHPQPCFVNVAFTRKKNPQPRQYDLIFLAAFYMGCEI
jgi:hypothetical protein